MKILGVDTINYKLDAVKNLEWVEIMEGLIFELYKKDEFIKYYLKNNLLDEEEKKKILSKFSLNDLISFLTYENDSILENEKKLLILIGKKEVKISNLNSIIDDFKEKIEKDRKNYECKMQILDDKIDDLEDKNKVSKNPIQIKTLEDQLKYDILKELFKTKSLTELHNIVTSNVQR